MLFMASPLTSLAADDTQFENGFADLFEHLGPSIMGRPLEPEHPDPHGSGDIVQLTSTGIARYSVGAAPSFFNGEMRFTWLPERGVVAWQGEAWLPPPPPPAAPAVAASDAGTVWDRLAVCESQGRWSVNTGNGYFGGLQEDMTAWRNHGGLQYAARPDLASRSEQIEVAQRILADQGWGAWPYCSRHIGPLT